MSTLAVWLYAVAALAFVLAVLLVVLAARSTARRGRTLSEELGLLRDDVDEAVGSAPARRGSRTSASPDIRWS